jgi:nucleoside-diphosphate kinase
MSEKGPESQPRSKEFEPQGTQSNNEDTLVIIKPDAADFGQAQQIISYYTKAGLMVSRHKWIGQVNKLALMAHYAEHFGMPYYKGLIQFMSSGRIVVLELKGDNAVSRVRALNGPTDPRKATAEEQNTIRVKFGGKSVPQNAVHASDSLASARRELWLWFESDLVCDENPDAWPR